jgi:uncharacterized protein YjiS (DUF1127 family)
MFKTLFKRAERKRVVSDLLQFDDHLLRDIGLTRGDLAALRRHGYRLPPHPRGHE